MKQSYFIFRQTKRSFSKRATLTLAYITREENEKQIFEDSPTFKPEQVSLNCYLENSRGEKKSDLTFDYSENSPTKREQIEKYIDKICIEKGVDPVKRNSRSIIYKENLYSVSPQWQQDIFKKAKTWREEMVLKNPKLDKALPSAEKIGMEIINFTLNEMREVHNEMFEYKDSFTICAVVHWDEVDLQKLMYDKNPVGSAHLHEVQIPFIKEKNNLDFEKIYSDTIKKEEELERINHEFKNERSRRCKNLNGKEHEEERKSILEEIKQRSKSERKKLIDKYGSYITEKDENGNRTGRLLKSNSQVINAGETIELSAIKQERVDVVYKKNDNGTYNLDNPQEPTTFLPAKESKKSCFYMNHLQDRMYKGIQERGKIKPQKKEISGKTIYYYQGKPITSLQAAIIQLAHNEYPNLNRGERSLTPDLDYTKRKTRIEMSKYREKEIIKSSQEKIDKLKWKEKDIERKIEYKTNELENICSLDPEVTGQDRTNDIFEIIDNNSSLNLTDKQKNEIKSKIKIHPITKEIKSIPIEVAELLIDERASAILKAEQLERSNRIRENIGNLKGTFAERKEIAENKKIIDFINHHPSIKELIDELIEKEYENQQRDIDKKRNEQEKNKPLTRGGIEI